MMIVTFVTFPMIMMEINLTMSEKSSAAHVAGEYEILYNLHDTTSWRKHDNHTLRLRCALRGLHAVRCRQWVEVDDEARVLPNPRSAVQEFSRVCFRSLGPPVTRK